jgi:hypothetical protein
LVNNKKNSPCIGNECTSDLCCEEPSPCTTTVVEVKRLYNSKETAALRAVKSAAMPKQDAPSWVLPAVGMFATCAMLGGFATWLYRHRRPNGLRAVQLNDGLEAGEDAALIE